MNVNELIAELNGRIAIFEKYLMDKGYGRIEMHIDSGILAFVEDELRIESVPLKNAILEAKIEAVSSFGSLLRAADEAIQIARLKNVIEGFDTLYRGLKS